MRILLLLTLALTLNSANASEQLAVPKNPFLADSTYPISHVNSAQSVNSRVAGFGDVGRKLTADEISWRPTDIGSANIRYSGKYSNGKRVLWLGGNRDILKFDADTLELISRKKVVDGNTLTTDEIVTHIDALDKLSGKEFIKKAISPLLSEPFQVIPGFYNFISNDNEQYLGVNDIHKKQLILRVYGDKIKDDPSSEIVVKRKLVLPDVDIQKTLIFGLYMTFDGVTILTLTDGTVFAISRELEILDRIMLPRIKQSDTSASDGGTGEGTFSSFIRNGTPIDDEGGVYIVTTDYMHRVQWTGEKLSLDETDGAWATRYDAGNRGSGTTPNLMGWGGDEDKLVLIGAGLGGERLLAFWRDEVPADWQGIKGYDRRLAAVVDIDFGENADPDAILEITQTVKGYGTFMMNSVPEKNYAADSGLPTTEAGQFFSLAVGQGKAPEYTNWGGAKYEWNPKTRQFEFRWQNTFPISYTTTVSIIDSADVLYSIGSRDGNWTLEGTNWHTGKSKFHYPLGKSQRFNPTGSSLNIAPNGALDCACTGGLGMVRVFPKNLTTKQSQK